MSERKKTSRKRRLYESKGWQPLYRLNLLRDYLSFDFEPLREKDWNWFMSAWETEELPETVASVLLLMDDRESWVRNAEDLRQEILADIDALINTEATDAAEIQASLDSVAKKLNQIRISPKWHPTTPNFELDYEDKDGSKRTRTVPNPALSKLWKDGRVLRFGKTKWMFTSTWFDVGSTPKEKLYGALATSLHDGSFSLLRICKECRKLYIADHLRQKYCCSTCGENYFNRGAAARVRTSRERKKTAEAKKRARDQEKKYISSFASLVTELRKVKHSTPVPIVRHIPGRWKTVREWIAKAKKGTPAGQIWKEVPPSTKHILEKYFHSVS